MARKYVEIPFSIVREHAAVRHLNAAAYGAYSLLVSAALWDGVDLAEQNDASLAFLSHAHGLSWQRMKKEVIKAVANSLPVVRAAFQKKLAASEAHGFRSQKVWLKAYAARMARKKIDESRLFAEQTVGATLLLQPTKALLHKESSSDMKEHRAVSQRNKLADPAKTQTE